MTAQITTQVLGEVAELSAQTVEFHATHSVTGASGSGSFSLAEAPGLVQYVRTHAYVNLKPESLRVTIRGPVSATIACTVDVCVIPDTYTPRPSAAAQIQTVQGNSTAQHSLLVGVQDGPVKFANGVAHQLKPEPHLGDLPQVCYVYNINGGAANSIATIRISGIIEARGIGFVQTW